MARTQFLRIGGRWSAALALAASVAGPASAKPLMSFYEGKAEAKSGRVDFWIGLDSKNAIGTLSAKHPFGDYRLHGSRSGTRLRGQVAPGKKPKQKVGRFNGAARGSVS